MSETTARRLGFAVKVLGRGGLPSHDARRWQSGPSLARSIDALYRILDYLRDEGIRMYRLTSDFVPYATHPDLPQFHGQLEAHATELARLGRYARRLDLRLSLYIDPWTFAGFLYELRDRAFDVMLEAKAKDLALLKLRQDLKELGFEGVLAWGGAERWRRAGDGAGHESCTPYPPPHGIDAPDDAHR